MPLTTHGPAAPTRADDERELAAMAAKRAHRQKYVSPRLAEYDARTLSEVEARERAMQISQYGMMER